MGVERAIHAKKNGQEIILYCRICNKELSREYYNRRGEQQQLTVNNCEHYQWIFVWEVFLDYPWIDVIRETIDNAVAEVDGNGGKYFLFPRDFVEKHL